MAVAQDFNFLRFNILSLLEGPGAYVLSFILKHGTDTPSAPITLDRYMMLLPKTSTANYCRLREKDKRRVFDLSELRQIENNPTWDNFDITLLYKAIRIGCKDIARLNDDSCWRDLNTMEGLITAIKNERNECVHERNIMTMADFEAKVSVLEDIFMKALMEAKYRYNVPDSDFAPVREKVLKDISNVRKYDTMEKTLESLEIEVLPLFKEESRKKLQYLYQHVHYPDLLSFLGLSSQIVNIQSLFCKIFLTDKTDVTKPADIDCCNLLTPIQPVGQNLQLETSSQVTQSTQSKKKNKSKPQFIMISGDAGSGKTTLINLIMSEWLRGSQECCIKHITEYDIVLWILCREKNRPSLQDFLQQVLPNIFVRIKDNLVTFLKEYKVLFLIDGLDELRTDSSSDQLVTDILNKGKDVPGFTILCTSRPETVHSFLAKTHDSYQQRKMEMKGIIPAHRSDFVLRYYDFLVPFSSKRDELKFLMKNFSQEEQFGLPLNLLLVATLFYADPLSVKKDITQTSLYLNIHKLCVDRLRDRLTIRSQGMKMLDCDKGIRYVLKVIYHVSLQGLLQGRLSLTMEDAIRLRENCQQENLPSSEVMAAFLCLREDVEPIFHLKYYAPHRSLQEFYAAREIVMNLADLEEGSIRSMLQDPSPPQLNKLRNLLVHVEGLLSQPEMLSLTAAIKEVKDLQLELHQCSVSSLESRGTSDLTQLMQAAKNGDLKTMQVLLRHGADPLATHFEGWTALHCAARNNHQQCVTALTSVTPPTHIHPFGVSPVHLASIESHKNVVKELADAGWPLTTRNSDGETPLHCAARGGNVAVSEYLVQHDIDPRQEDHYGWTPLDIAKAYGHDEMEKWLAENGGAQDMDEAHLLQLVRLWQGWDRARHCEIVSWMVMNDKATVAYIPEYVDGHLLDTAGLTPIHVAAKRGLLSCRMVEMLHKSGMSLNVVTPDNMTPIDLAREEGHLQVVEALQQHHCEQDSSLSKQKLHKELLTVISKGDYVQEVYQYLCKGAPVEPEGGSSRSALQVAINTDRVRTVRLLLASGASLSAGLLKEVWQTPDVSPRVLAALTTAYSCRLLAEQHRLEEFSILSEGIEALLKVIKGDTPWEVAWQLGKECNHSEISGLMAVAARFNCPLTAAFLQSAGAWPFYSTEDCVSPLHAALDNKHWHMAEVLVRDLGACPYMPDIAGRLPRDLMPETLQRQLERMLFKQENRKLEDLENEEKTDSGKKKVGAMLKLQEELYCSYKKGQLRPSLSTDIANALLLLASRKGLTQVMYLLLRADGLNANGILSDTSNTTALHEAASHGKDACVALLLNHGADPLLPDKYGQTPRLLAAMFGHKSTLHLLPCSDGQDPPCRAGTTSEQVEENFTYYLECYDKLNSREVKSLTPHDRHDDKSVFRKLLKTIDLRSLQQQAEDFAIDFLKGEAKTVKEVVMRELKAIVDRMVITNTAYCGNIKLVGSAEDGSKLYAPDEFDVNLVISPEMVDVLLEDEKTEGRKTRKKILVKSKDDGFEYNRLTDGLYEAVRQDLARNLLSDKRLSLVPPGLIKTQVGIALNLAWQGEEKDVNEKGKKMRDKRSTQWVSLRPLIWPLLLIGVDLVPVLKVPWKEGIEKPSIKPLDTSTMCISNTEDGSWRCSFAQAEAEVLRTMDRLGHHVQLMGKLLLSCLKAEPWMPRDMKTFCTWFIMKSWKISPPNGFCLKNAILRWLSQEQGKRHTRKIMKMKEEEDPVKVLLLLFRSMCDVSDDESEKLHPGVTPAFFGAECESYKLGYGAPFIVQYLEEFLKEEEGRKEKRLKKTRKGK